MQLKEEKKNRRTYRLLSKSSGKVVQFLLLSLSLYIYATCQTIFKWGRMEKGARQSSCSVHSLLVRIGSRENRLDNEARLHIVVYIYAARHKSSFNSHSEWDIVWYLLVLVARYSFSLLFSFCSPSLSLLISIFWSYSSFYFLLVFP